MAFASFIKGETSYHDDIFELAISLNNTIVKETRENPEMCLNLGVYQKKDDIGVLIGTGIKRRFLEYEGVFLASYVFMKNNDILLLDISVLDPKTSKISFVYSAFLEGGKEKNLFFIGGGILYEISPSLTGGVSLKFGNSLRLTAEVIYK